MKLMIGGPGCLLPIFLLRDVVGVKIAPDSLTLASKSDLEDGLNAYSLKLVEEGDDFEKPVKSAEQIPAVAVAAEKATAKSIRGTKSGAKAEVVSTKTKTVAKAVAASTKTKSQAKADVASNATSQATTTVKPVACNSMEVANVYCDVTGSIIKTPRSNEFGADYSFEVKGQCDELCKRTPGCAAWVFSDGKGCFLSKVLPDWQNCPAVQGSTFGRVPCAVTTTTTTLLPGAFMMTAEKWCYPGNARLMDGANFNPNMVGADEKCCTGSPGKCQNLCEKHPKCKMWAYSRVGACYLGPENMNATECPTVSGAYVGNRKTQPYEACDKFEIKDNKWCYPWNHIKTGVAGFNVNEIGGDFSCCVDRPDKCHALCVKAGPRCVSWSMSETGGCFLAENLPDQTHCPAKNGTWFGMRSCLQTTTTSTQATPLAQCEFSVTFEKDCFFSGKYIIKEQRVLPNGNIIGSGFNANGADMGCCHNSPGKCQALCEAYPQCVAWKLKEGEGCFLSSRLPSSECAYDVNTYVGRKVCPQRHTLSEVQYQS